MADELTAQVSIASESLRVVVSPLGAELQSVRSGDGAEWLWQGAPAFWSGRAPLLFPVIGKSPNGSVTVDGAAFPMPPHGFARTSRFAVSERSTDRCRFRLVSSAETLAHYPFDFELNIDLHLQGSLLSTVVDIVNRGARPMPVSFGFHPAFVWPLPGCSASERHVFRLAQTDEPMVRRLNTDGSLQPESQPSPFHAGELLLRHALFEADALIFERGTGSSFHYGVPGKPGIRVEQDNFPQLGLWTKPGAPFICIEPWQGLPVPSGASAELTQRPGIALLAPGATRRLGMAIEFGVIVPSSPTVPRSSP